MVKHGHRKGWRRWKARAGKRKAYLLDQINKLTLQFSGKLVDVVRLRKNK